MIELPNGQSGVCLQGIQEIYFSLKGYLFFHKHVKTRLKICFIYTYTTP